jgi:hypothetical protein
MKRHPGEDCVLPWASSLRRCAVDLPVPVRSRERAARKPYAVLVRDSSRAGHRASSTETAGRDGHPAPVSPFHRPGSHGMTAADAPLRLPPAPTWSQDYVAADARAASVRCPPTSTRRQPPDHVTFGHLGRGVPRGVMTRSLGPAPPSTRPTPSRYVAPSRRHRTATSSAPRELARLAFATMCMTTVNTTYRIAEHASFERPVPRS